MGDDLPAIVRSLVVGLMLLGAEFQTPPFASGDEGALAEIVLGDA